MFARTICVMGRMLDQQDGLGVYARNLLDELLRLDPASRYLILLRTPRHARTFERFANAETRVLPARVKVFWDQVLVPIAARQAGADIVFNPKFSIPLFSGRPAAFVLQGSEWYVNPQNYQWWDNLYIRLALPAYCRKATQLLAISNKVVDDLAPRLRLDRSRVTVSYAAPSPHFSPEGNEDALEAFRRRYALPQRFILTVTRAYHTGHGRLPPYPGSNNERLLKAYRRYRADGGELPLVVVGRNIEAYLRAQEFGDADLEGVHFTGYIPHETMHMAYQLAELFVIAALHESFAFPLVEAMACGCPVVASATGACPEIGGGAVVLVDPYDTEDIARRLAELAGSERLRETLRKAGLQRAGGFTWSATAERTLTVFDALTQRQPVRA